MKSICVRTLNEDQPAQLNDIMSKIGDKLIRNRIVYSQKVLKVTYLERYGSMIKVKANNSLIKIKRKMQLEKLGTVPVLFHSG